MAWTTTVGLCFMILQLALSFSPIDERYPYEHEGSFGDPCFMVEDETVAPNIYGHRARTFCVNHNGWQPRPAHGNSPGRFQHERRRPTSPKPLQLLGRQREPRRNFPVPHANLPLVSMKRYRYNELDVKQYKPVPMPLLRHPQSTNWPFPTANGYDKGNQKPLQHTVSETQRFWSKREANAPSAAFFIPIGTDTYTDDDEEEYESHEEDEDKDEDDDNGNVDAVDDVEVDAVHLVIWSAEDEGDLKTIDDEATVETVESM